MVAPNLPPISRLNLALLAGGRSTRMGSDKFLLEYPDGTPVYLNRLRMLQEAFPEADNICIVLRDRTRAEHVRIPPEMGVHVLFVAATVGSAHVAGPAAGLHALYCFDPTSHWLVIPCDYPLLDGEDLRNLYDHYRDPVTCFSNGQRSTEPIVAIWSPDALIHLTNTVVENRSGLSNLMARLGGHTIPARYDHCLFNTNTREEWDDALLLLKDDKGSDGTTLLPGRPALVIRQPYPLHLDPTPQPYNENQEMWWFPARLSPQFRHLWQNGSGLC